MPPSREPASFFLISHFPSGFCCSAIILTVISFSFAYSHKIQSFISIAMRQWTGTYRPRSCLVSSECLASSVLKNTHLKGLITFKSLYQWKCVCLVSSGSWAQAQHTGSSGKLNGVSYHVLSVYFMASTSLLFLHTNFFNAHKAFLGQTCHSHFY